MTKKLEEAVENLTKQMQSVLKWKNEVQAAFAGKAAAGTKGGEATESELDDKFGNPKLGFNPRDWKGSNVKGLEMSYCPPEALVLYADAKEYFGKKADENDEKDAKGRPKSHWDFKDARLARGWARRLKAGWKPAPKPAHDPTGGFGGEEPPDSDPIENSEDDGSIPF